jgi:predicted transport protein
MESPMKYERLTALSIRDHPQLNERWVQERIAEEPSILGLGDLILKDKEHLQPRAGRLDLLLQEADGSRRYEVEIQLGKTDESHIIRTIEYWDIERKRYPQYDHTAVIVAEEITSRFLNVISLFNGTIPLVAIQMMAVQLGDSVSLVFTTVLDQLRLGLVDEDEEVHEATDRTYWEARGTKATLAMADELLQIIKTLDPALEFKYNKFYIGLAKEGQPNNFVILRPQKNAIRIEPRVQKSETIEKQIDAAGLDVMEYDNKWGRYRVRLTKNELREQADVLRALFDAAYRDSGLGKD